MSKPAYFRWYIQFVPLWWYIRSTIHRIYSCPTHIRTNSWAFDCACSIYLYGNFFDNAVILYLEIFATANPQTLALNSCNYVVLVINRTPINILLLSLAVADMMVGLFITPRFIFHNFFKHPDGLTGKWFCTLLTGSNFTWLGGMASAFTLVAIAFERYYAVMYPYGNKGKLTYGKLKVCKAVNTTVWPFFKYNIYFGNWDYIPFRKSCLILI